VNTQPTLVLIHSPFVGPACWRAVAARLPGAMAVDYGGVSGPDWYEGAAARIAAMAGDGRWTAVLHSGAGAFAPALAAGSPTPAGLVFVDAVLPTPGAGWLDTAPPALAQRLAGLVTDGRLSPWNSWFAADPAERLIADASLRAAFVAELPGVPWAFLEARAPSADAWARLPAAYVQLSDAYGAEAGAAGARGWPVRAAPLNHLAMLTDPDKVAALLAGLPSEELSRP
jgi:hypothetical protein